MMITENLEDEVNLLRAYLVLAENRIAKLEQRVQELELKDKYYAGIQGRDWN